MLTKNDLRAISSIVKTEIDASIGNKIEPLIDKKLKPIQKDIAYIRKTVDVLVESSDRRTTHLEKRVKRVEDHLRLPTQN